MAQKQPASGKDLLHLLLVDLRLDKDTAAHQTAVSIDETSDICSHVTLLCAFLPVVGLTSISLSDTRPTIGRHQLCPAPIEASMVDFTVTVVTGPSLQLFVESLVPETHLVTEKTAPGYHTSAGLRAALPIVHVVLLERAGRTEAPHASQSDRL